MGIYQRDQINYGGMLGNAMANRMAYAQREADAQRQMGQNWGNAINQGAQGIAAGLNTWNQQRIDQGKLAQQQQFQAEQRALERANELKRAQEQQKWQAEQNALQRESTEYIAAMNRNNITEERAAQNIMHYQNALSTMQYAQQALDNARPGTNEYFQAQRDLAYAKSKVEYYQGMVPEQLWYKETEPVITGDVEAEAALKQFGSPAPLKKWQQEDLLNEWNALNERFGGKYDDVTAKRMNDIADLLNNTSLKVKTATKGKTINQINAEDQATMTNWKPGMSYDTKRFKIKYVKGTPSLVRK